ncbi:60S ribosomal protein L28-like [Hyaena hyaena]|uniref:60S ribosomal protein L28-like n=1 Tax=Hyaena hyaena TaxID=95912 RepID=UPI0019229C08|nr:60S ribosomal protein L28-like [Hyaena hyaena]
MGLNLDHKTNINRFKNGVTQNVLSDDRLIRRKAVGTGLLAKGTGVVEGRKQRSGQQKPTTSCVRTTVHKNALATLGSPRLTIRKSKNRPDLHMAAGSPPKVKRKPPPPRAPELLSPPPKP